MVGRLDDKRRAGVTHYEAVKLVRLAAGTSECPDLADFLCYLEDILERDWEIVEQLGETEYYEVERDERGTEQSRAASPRRRSLRPSGRSSWRPRASTAIRRPPLPSVSSRTTSTIASGRCHERLLHRI